MTISWSLLHTFPTWSPQCAPHVVSSLPYCFTIFNIELTAKSTNKCLSYFFHFIFIYTCRKKLVQNTDHLYNKLYPTKIVFISDKIGLNFIFIESRSYNLRITSLTLSSLYFKYFEIMLFVEIIFCINFHRTFKIYPSQFHGNKFFSFLKW